MAKSKKFYQTCLATSDEKDVQRLETYAAKGWHLKQVKIPYLSYELEEYEGAKRTYLIDYQTNKDNLYISTYKNRGWSYVCSNQNLHYFKGSLNIPRIYTDIEGKKALYQSKTKQFLFVFLLVGLINVLVFGGFAYFNTQNERILPLVSALFAIGLFLLVSNPILAYASYTYLKRAKSIRKEV